MSTPTMLFVQPAQDLWRAAVGEFGPTPIPPLASHSLLTLEQWQAVCDSWPDHLPVGVTLSNTADVEELAEHLPRLALIALQFPKWVDGRAYSQARLLRSRYRFQGEVRATGEVLVDMMPLLARTGFDAVVLRADQSIDAAERALGFFAGHYQGDTHDNRPLFALPPGTAERLAREPEFVQGGASI